MGDMNLYRIQGCYSLVRTLFRDLKRLSTYASLTTDIRAEY